VSLSWSKIHADARFGANDQKAYATCEIEFIGNFETDMQPVIWSDGAGAHFLSVSGSFQLHLEAMAVNRAFARCVRTFLNVPIYGKDEFDPEANKAFEKELKTGKNPLAPSPVVQSSGPDSFDAQGILADKCKS
jgi:hypothetical protein